MKLRKRVHEEMARTADEIPHYYEVGISNHPNGVKQVCCGTWRDVEGVLERYPDSTVKKVFPPKTLDVVAETVGTECALNQASPALPESQAEELTF